jgi:hypothetical protein
MNLRRWLSIILIMGLILALSSLGAQADPYGPYHHPRGHAYGWDGPGAHHFDRHYKHFQRSYRGPHNHYYVERRVYTGPPAVAYVAPVAPVMGIPYAQPQPYISQPVQPGPPGFHGQFNYNF